MSVNELKIGDTLYAISDASWLIKGNKHEVVSIDENYVTLNPGLSWPLQSIHEHFTLVLNQPAY